jgi:hypothetical protein
MERDAAEAPLVLVPGLHGDFLVPGADRAEIEESGSVSRPGLAMLLDQVEPGASVLDVGSGPGFFAVPLQRAARANGRVWCFEPDAALASLLSRNLVLNGLANSVRIVPGTGWPRLDDWVSEAGIEGVDVVRADGCRATSVLLDEAGAVLERRPLVFVDRAAEAPEDGADRLESLLGGLGYEFYRHAGPPDEQLDGYRAERVRAFARVEGGFDLLAVPGGSAAASRLGQRAEADTGAGEVR